MTTTQTTFTTPAAKSPAAAAELAAAHAAYEVQRVKNAVATSFDGHPMALSDAAWEYVAELLRNAYTVGVGSGEQLQMADINRRYTLTGRR